MAITVSSTVCVTATLTILQLSGRDLALPLNLGGSPHTCNLKMNVADSEVSHHPSPPQFSSHVASHGSSFSQFQEDRLTLNLEASLAVVQGFPVGWVKLSGFCLFVFPFWQLCRMYRETPKYHPRSRRRHESSQWG